MKIHYVRGKSKKAKAYCGGVHSVLMTNRTDDWDEVTCKRCIISRDAPENRKRQKGYTLEELQKQDATRLKKSLNIREVICSEIRKTLY